MNLKPFRALAAGWREEAATFRKRGAEQQATMLESCAEELEQDVREWESEELTLQQAEHESGYTAGHLGRLVGEGHILNAGRSGAPLIRRVDLPRKPGHSADGLDNSQPVDSKEQIARSVADSWEGGSDE